MSKTPRKPHTKKIKKLEEKVQELLSKDVIEAPKEFFTAEGVGCHYDVREKQYKLTSIIYNHETGAARVVETYDAGDSKYRQEFEMKKYIVTKLNINKVNKE
jgi:hypothetical protein